MHVLQQRSATQESTHMQQISTQQVTHALQAHASTQSITAAQVQALLGDASVTFAQVTYVTAPQLAAAHKQQNILKVTHANVMLCANVSVHAQVYARKVRKHAARFAQNDVAAVQQFTAQENYFAHTACYSIVAHKQHAHKQYLYAIYNNARSVYVHDGVVVNKQHVAQYMTRSAAEKLLQGSNTVHNKTHNIVHDVQVRTIALDNIVAMRARKQLLTL
jgi:hypothetical protein